MKRTPIIKQKTEAKKFEVVIDVRRPGMSYNTLNSHRKTAGSNRLQDIKNKYQMKNMLSRHPP
jgi:hypothetical protein